jgi:RNA polymerase sigma-54 factor
MWQLNLQTTDELLREIGAAIVGNIDEDGYLVASLDEIAALGSWDITDVERALEHVQGFDPIGVAARDPPGVPAARFGMGLAGSPAETRSAITCPA